MSGSGRKGKGNRGPSNLPSTRRPDESTVQSSVTMASFQGPLPPPSLLEQYNNVIPNGAERIMAMAEQQSVHRQQLEKTALQADVQRADLGLKSALAVSIAFLLASCGLVLADHDVAGTVLGTVDIVALAGTFIYGSITRRNERMQKAKVMAGKES